MRKSEKERVIEKENERRREIQIHSINDQIRLYSILEVRKEMFARVELMVEMLRRKNYELDSDETAKIELLRTLLYSTQNTKVENVPHLT